QRRRYVVGVGHRETVYSRPDLLGPALSDGQLLRSALRFARVLERRDADPRPEDAQGDVLQDAGRGSERTRIVRTSLPCLGRGEPDAALGLLGRGENLEPARQQP